MSNNQADTVPRCLFDNAEKIGGAPAFGEKYLGIWQTYSWHDTAAEVRALACGLAALGLERGDMVAIIGDNRPHLYWVFFASQSLGAVPVPMYQNGVAAEFEYVLNHAAVRFAVVEDQEQTDKLLEIKDQCPSLERIIYHNPRGMRSYEQSFVHSYADIQEKGRAYDVQHPDYFEHELAVGKADDVVGIFYTSGTTGTPKGVQLTSKNLLSSARDFNGQEGLNERDRQVNYAPMAWIGDHLFMCSSLSAGSCTNCPESPETLLVDVKEIGPTMFFAAPAIWEGLLTTITIRMEDASRLKRWLFQ